MLELPNDLTDPLKLADWLELYALSSPDRNSSQGDLESELRRAALFELADDTAIELKTMEVFDELEQRVNAAKEAYPFDLDYRGILQLKSTSWEDFPAYTFCLCLSYFGLRETRLVPKLFEQVSCLAAKGYLQGDVIEFGWPRREEELPSSFTDAITEMCKRIGEGRGYREQSSLDRKDDTVDLVAWKEFADRKSSKILMFGQCASGQEWEEKRAELDPMRFWNQWMEVSPVGPYPLKSYFIPHRVARNKWEYFARNLILFDRCRIAFWAHQVRADYDPIIAWLRDFFAQVAL